MYGWSVRLPVGTGQHSFPGCIAMVEEGNLGFLLKSHQAEHSLKKAVRARGVKGDKRGTETGRTHRLNIKGWARRRGMEGRQKVTRGNERRQNHETAFLICFQFWVVTAHFVEIRTACLSFQILIFSSCSLLINWTEVISTETEEGVQWCQHLLPWRRLRRTQGRLFSPLQLHTSESAHKFVIFGSW